jgi:nucleotide-binding universal stress UspA family protein
MIEHVVVAWDGSAGATAAAEWAAVRQGGRGGIELVRVADELRPPGEWETTAGTMQGGVRALEREAGRLRERHPELQVQTSVLIGRREEELERLARPGTLLVVGTEERVGPKARFRFSLAIRLAAHAQGPVAVVPVGFAGDVSGPVVVGVDGTAASIAAARLAAEEALRRGTDLVAIHAWWEATDWEAVLPLDAGVFATFEHIHRRVLDQSVDEVALAFPGLRIDRRLVRGPRAEVLLSAAEGAFELVVGKHSRAVARDVLLGTVSRNLLLDTWVPTIVAGSVDSVAPLELAGRGARSSGGHHG